MSRAPLREVKEIIEYYKLEPLTPEGGWFNRFWYKEGIISQIYYLLTEDDFSEFHILPHQEQIIFLSGDPVEHYRGLPETHTLEKVILGQDFKKGEERRVRVEAHTSQAMRLVKGGKWALMSTIMSPPFKTEEYRSLSYEEMIKTFPVQSALIKDLTRF